MNWNQVRIHTTHTGIEPVTALTIELGITGNVVEDAQDFKTFESSNEPHWDYVDDSLDRLRHCETSITVYLADNAQGLEVLDKLREGLARLGKMDTAAEYGRLDIETDWVREEDWADNWKQYFKPTAVGSKLMIKPTWETLESADCTGRAVLEIDPSASFGTGTHHTTRLCLELLEDCVHGGEAVLDLGCGSGILGIAALLLGAQNVTAVDIDENSVRIARENFRQNRIAPDRLCTLCGDLTDDAVFRAQIGSHRYGIVTANIVADVLIALAPCLKYWMEEDGALLLSGIIEQREADVLTAVLANGLVVEKRLEEGGWIALCCARNHGA